MQRLIWIALIAWLAVGGEASAQMLAEEPRATGGNPVGIWEADRTPLQVYAAPELLASISGLSFGGTVAGRLTLESTGGFQADYIVTARVSVSFLGTPIKIDVADTVRTEGTYQVMNDTALVLAQNTTPVLRDTMGFSVEGDSLRLIQGVPLGGYAELVSALVPPGADLPFAVLSMGKVGDPTGPIGPITADFDGSGVVDFPDFLMFVVHYGARSGDAAYDATYDLNGNGEIGFTDFLEFARQFGHKA